MIEAYRHGWAAPFLDRYNAHLLGKSFASIRIAGLDRLRSIGGAAILAPNHSCWWDGAVDLYVSRQVLRFRSYLMMGEAELSKHAVFSSLGVFSVPESSPLTSVRYICRQLQENSGPRVLWIYPQGEMLSARAPVTIKDGVLSISGATGAPVVPIAHRYEFLQDDHADVLIRAGEPLNGLSRNESDRERLEYSLAALLKEIDGDLAAARLGDYEIVLRGTESRNKRLERLRRSG